MARQTLTGTGLGKNQLGWRLINLSFTVSSGSSGSYTASYSFNITGVHQNPVSATLTATIKVNGTVQKNHTFNVTYGNTDYSGSGTITIRNATDTIECACVPTVNASVSGNFYWTGSPSASATAPGWVKLNGSTNTEAPLPGTYEITWGPGSVSGQTLTGYYVHSYNTGGSLIDEQTVTGEYAGEYSSTFGEYVYKASLANRIIYNFAKTNTQALNKYYDWKVRTNGSSVNSAVSTAYARVKYVSGSCTVTWNANGGSVSPSSSTGTVGNTVTAPEPTRNGYLCVGWSTDTTDNNIVVSPGQSWKYEGTRTLYAIWAGYTVTTASSNTTWGTASGGGTYAGTNLTVTATAKTGGHFTSWSGGNVNGNTNTSVSFVPTSNFTATANFAANTFYVKFNANGGSGSMSNETFTYGTAKALTSNGFTAPSGYTFYGWATSVANATAGTRAYTNGQSVSNLTTTNGGTVNLYAMWYRTINFYSGSGNATNNTRTQWWNGSTGAGAAITSQTAANCADISGWTELGWRDDTSAGAAEVAFNTSVTPTTTAYRAVYSRTATFYHGYNKAASTGVTQYYNTNGAYALTAATAAQCTDVTTWTELGWRDDTTASTAEIAFGASYTGSSGTFYAVYRRTGTVSYAGNGNTGGSTGDTTSGYQYLNSGNTSLNPASLSVTLATNGFTKTGYNFSKWNIGNAGATYTWTPAYNATTAVTATATWSARTYTVTVNLNGGTGGPGSSFTATYGTNTSLAVPTKAGYDFVGWVALNHGSTSGQRIGNLHSQAGGGLFTDGLPTKYLYGGSGTNNSTLSLVNADTTAGVYGSKMMRITEPGTSEKGVGWYSVLTSVANAKYIVCFVAKAPVGTYFIQANNSIGSGSSIEWITPQAGTGDWKTYAYKVNAGSSGTFSTFGHQVVCGNASSVSGGTNPGNVTVDVSCYVIYGNSMALNAGTNYIPSATATSDTIYALWIEKSYTISYNVNGGNALSTNTVINQSGSWREQLNPTSTFSNSRHQYAGAVFGGANSVANYSWFRVTRPTKADSVSSSTSAITTSYSAASAVTATGSTKTVTTTTPNNFYSWTITGMDSTTHRYWGRASASTTTNTAQSFSSTSITVTGTNYADGAPPMEFGNLRQTPGTVTFTAGWTNGTASTSTTYSAITLPNVPAKANTTSTITRTVSYNANGGSSTPSSQSVSPTAPITWTSDSKWYTTSALTTSAGTQGSSYTPQASGTLYAKYTSTTGSYNSPSLTLASAISKTATTSTATTTFNVNGGSGSNSSITNTVTQPYNFNKWAAGSTTGTQYSASSSFTPSADAVTMYATWTDGTKTGSSITTPIAPTRVETSSVTVSYNSDGGSAVSSSTSTKTDTYPFSGWALGSTTGATVSAGANINPTASTTYYAKWGTAAVTYSAVALPTTPTKAGYKLVGWTDGTTTYTTTYTPNSASAVTLTAVWEQAGTVMIYSTSDNRWHWAIPYIYKISDSKWHQADAYIYKGNAWKKCGL